MNKGPYLGYTFDDFFRYFSNSFVRTPKGIGKIVDRNRDGRQMYVIYSSEHSLEPVDLSAVTWDDVFPSNLGYRNVDNVLCYVTKSPRRNSSKGINDRNARFAPSIVCSLGKKRNLDSFKVAQQLYNPVYPNYKAAVAMLADKEVPAVGIALSCDVAVALNPCNPKGLTMLGNERVIAESIDFGNSWEWKTPCARDIASRYGVN